MNSESNSSPNPDELKKYSPGDNSDMPYRLPPSFDFYPLLFIEPPKSSDESPCSNSILVKFTEEYSK